LYWKFVCKRDTEAECFERALFGDAPSLWDEVKEVKRGDTLFLYNLDTDVLFGPFTALSDGGLYLEREAWEGRFPAQVRVSLETVAMLRDASKDFNFLRSKTIRLSEHDAQEILAKLAPKVREVPSGIRQEIQRLDGEIHELAHRIEEALMLGRGHPADRVVELDRLKGEFVARMKDFVWAVRKLDRATGLLGLPSNR
jgi:hypothetical protein